MIIRSKIFHLYGLLVVIRALKTRCDILVVADDFFFQSFFIYQRADVVAFSVRTRTA
jgi:hypothetical protein